MIHPVYYIYTPVGIPYQDKFNLDNLGMQGYTVLTTYIVNGVTFILLFREIVDQ